MNLTRWILERWPEGISVQDYPELMDILMKIIHRNGRWELPDGSPDLRQIRRLMEAIESGQAPAMGGILRGPEQRQLELMAGKPINSYAELEREGLTMERVSRAPPKPTLREKVAKQIQEERPKFQIPPGIAEQMARGVQFVSQMAPDGSIQFIPADSIQPESVPEDGYEFEEGEEDTVIPGNTTPEDTTPIIEQARARMLERHKQQGRGR